MKTIGAFEAKTQLSKLLANVANGERYLITVRGKPTASLGPVSGETRQDTRDRISAFRKRMSRSLKKISVRELQELKTEGRK